MIKLLSLLKAKEVLFVLILVLQDNFESIKTNYLRAHNNNLIKLINCMNNTMDKKANSLKINKKVIIFLYRESKNKFNLFKTMQNNCQLKR